MSYTSMMLRPFWSSWSIAQLILLLVLAPLIIVSVILTYYQIDGRLQDMIDRLGAEGKFIASHLSNDSEHYMFTGNLERLQELVDGVVDQENVESVELLEQERNLIVSAGSQIVNNVSPSDLVITEPIIYRDTMVDETEQKIVPLEVIVGWVHMKMSPDVVEKNKQSILFNSLIVLLGGLIVSITLAYFISRSLLIVC
jgi:sensor histidine kinase regulating citrate/malate metabolism